MTDDGIVAGSGKVPLEGAPVGATRAFRWEDGEFTPPHRLQLLAGHADIKITLGYYIHTDDAYDDQVRSAGLGRPEQDTLRTHVADSAVIEAA